MGGDGEEAQPLRSFTDSDTSSPVPRSGTVWTAIAHVITGVIGAGVLSLAWSMAQLGWIAGPVTMLAFAGITIFSANLLCDCYRSPDPESGPIISRSYVRAVKLYLGERSKTICAVFLQECFYGTGIAYIITTATSFRAIKKSDCYHRKDRREGVQILLSQIPDFHNMAWLSIIAAIMSFSYAFIGLGLGLAKVIAIFGYEGYFEVTPTREPNNEEGSNLCNFITSFFYLCCGCFGYAAFGDVTPRILLSGFGFYEPYWLIDFANACVILHLVGGYQVYSQPLFAFVEGWLSEKFPNSTFVSKTYALRPQFLPSFQLSPLRLCFRTAYVLGAFNFWPLAIYFPLEMYLVQRKIGAWTRKWVVFPNY